MKILKLEYLVGACSEQLEIVQNEWPNGIPLTEDSANRCLELNFDFDWVVQTILLQSAREEYRKVSQPAREEYRKVSQPAREEYEKVSQSAWEEYRKVTQSAREEYEKVSQSAREEYEKVCIMKLLALLKAMPD